MNEFWFKSQTDDYQQLVFDKHATLRLLDTERLSDCLADLGIKLADANPLFDQMDVKDKGFLCFQEFKRYIQRTTPLRSWVASHLPVADLLADLIAHAVPVTSEGEQLLKELCKLDWKKLEAVLCGMGEGVRRMISESISHLEEVMQVQQSHAGGTSKFQVEVLSVGKASDFHGGMDP